MAFQLHQDEIQPVSGGIGNFGDPFSEADLDQYRDLVLDFKELSGKAYTGYKSACARWYTTWRNGIVTRGYRGSNNLPIGYLFSVIESNLARKQDVMWGEEKFVQAVPTGPEDQEAARKNELLLEAQHRFAETRRKSLELDWRADICGTGIWAFSWMVKKGQNWKRDAESDVVSRARAVPHPLTGQMGIKYQGPNWRVVDNIDFDPYPGKKRIAEMPRIGENYFMDFEHIVAGSEGDRPQFFPEVVQKMRYEAASRGVIEEWKARKDMAAGGVNEELYTAMSRFDKPVQCYDLVGKAPRGMGRVDPQTGEFCDGLLITLANERHVLRVVPIPLWDREIPYGAYSPFFDGDWFWAPGKIELGERLQWAINKYASRKLDLLDKIVDPLTLFTQDSEFDPARALTGNPFMPISGNDVSETTVRQLYPNMAGVDRIYGEIEYLWRAMQQQLGLVDDISLGMDSGGSDRQTAHEFEGRKQAVGLRLALEVAIAEFSWVEPLCNMFMQGNRQWLPFPVELALIGANSWFDPVTETFVAPTKTLTPSFEDIHVNMNYRALGATRQISRMMRMQGVNNFIAATAPTGQLALLNQRAWLRQIMPIYGIGNVDELIGTSEEVKRRQFELEMARGAGQSLASGNGNGGRGRGPGADLDAIAAFGSR